jgi:hypothetical protein
VLGRPTSETPMRLRSRLLLPFVALGLAAGSVAVAEDVDAPSLFASSKAAYDAKKYGRCLADLQALVAQIQRERSALVGKALPAALEGWTAEEVDTAGETAALNVFVGGGLHLRREYAKDDVRVTVDLLADSPLVATYGMYLANPAFLPANMKLVTIKGRRGVSDSEGPKTILVLNGNRSVLTVEAQGATAADVEAYANGVDYDRLEKSLED